MRALLLAGPGCPAGHRSWPGQVGVSRLAKFLQHDRAAVPTRPTSAVPCGLRQLQGGAPHPLPWLHPSGHQIAPAHPAYLGGRHSSAGVWGGCGTCSPAGWYWGPRRLTSRPGRSGGGDSDRRRARLACLPTPSQRGSCGRRQPIGWADQGLPGARDPKASAL